jgi:hypothetical protein
MESNDALQQLLEQMAEQSRGNERRHSERQESQEKSDSMYEQDCARRHRHMEAVEAYMVLGSNQIQTQNAILLRIAQRLEGQS